MNYKKLLLPCAALALTITSQASIILFDFGTDGAPTAPDTNGNYWNSFASNGVIADVIDSQNNLTGFSMTVSGPGGFSGGGGPAVTSIGAPLNISKATTDYVYGSGVVFTFSNLSAGSYDFTFFGARSSPDLRVGNFAVQGLNSGDVNLTSSVAGPNNVNTSETGSVLSIVPDVSGNIVITQTTVTSLAYLNAFSVSVTPIPEPGSIAAFIGLISLGLVIVQRRRK